MSALQEEIKEVIKPLERQIEELKAFVQKRLSEHKYVSIAEYARHFRVSEETVRRKIKSGDIKNVEMIGNQYRIQINYE